MTALGLSLNMCVSEHVMEVCMYLGVNTSACPYGRVCAHVYVYVSVSLQVHVSVCANACTVCESGCVYACVCA